MFYIEMHEDGHRIEAGKPGGYKTEAEAIEAAKRCVDDACPRNTVHVYHDIGHAFLQGDGEPGYVAADKS